MTPSCLKQLTGDEYTREYQLPSGEYTGESQLPCGEYIRESRLPCVNIPGSPDGLPASVLVYKKSMVPNTAGSLHSTELCTHFIPGIFGTSKCFCKPILAVSPLLNTPRSNTTTNNFRNIEQNSKFFLACLMNQEKLFDEKKQR
jgi:hypothetical protein